jgi:hypothetical protein
MNEVRMSGWMDEVRETNDTTMDIFPGLESGSGGATAYMELVEAPKP